MATDRQGHGAAGTGGAMALTVIGAALILIQSVYNIAFGRFLFYPVWGGPDVSLRVLGGLGVAIAILLEIFAAALYFAPRHHVFLGVAILTLALLSLYTGGGFLAGAFLAYVGSLIAVFASVAPARRAWNAPMPAEAVDDPVIEADLLASPGRR